MGLTARELLRRGALLEALAAAVGDDPETRAVRARVLVRVGRPRDALREAEAAAALAEGTEIALALGEALVASGEPAAGRAVLSAAYEAVRAARDGETVRVGAALAEACRAAGDAATGLGIATRVAGLAEAMGGPELADALAAQGACACATGDLDEALRALTGALAVRRAEDPESVEVAALLDTLGAVARGRRKPFDAVRYHREALALWEAALGEGSAPSGACRHALAQALHRTGDFRAARDEMARALAVTEETLGADHVDAWITRFELGRYEVDVGRTEEGLRVMERCRGEVAARLGRQHPVVRAMDRFL